MTAKNSPNNIYDRIDKRGPDECWPWTGRLSYHGYGMFDYNNESWMAHRFLYEYENGPIPTGLEVMHSCSNRSCCNSKHLSLGTHAENMKTRTSKLSKDEIIYIKNSDVNQHILAQRFGVHQSTISRIKRHSRFYKNV